MNMVSGIFDFGTLSCSAYICCKVCHSSTISWALAAEQIKCTMRADNNQFFGKSRGYIRITGCIYSKSLIENDFDLLLYLVPPSPLRVRQFHNQRLTDDHLRQRYSVHEVCVNLRGLGYVASRWVCQAQAGYQEENQILVEQCNRSDVRTAEVPICVRLFERHPQFNDNSVPASQQ
jgi:hypothetical protein